MTELNALRSSLLDLHSPVVMIASSPAAETICTGRNGLTLADILRPYSHLNQLKATFKIGESALNLKDLKLSLHPAPHIFQPKPEIIEDYLRAVLSQVAQRHTTTAVMQQDTLTSILNTAGPPPDLSALTPWYTDYRNEFVRMLRFGEHEMIDHPVAVIYVVPADVTNPASHFEALQNQAAVLPPQMHGTQVGVECMFPARDKDFAKHYLLLQDCSEGRNESSDKRAAMNLAAIAKVYGEAHCSLLCINTGGVSEIPPDFFRPFQKPGLPGGGAGEPEGLPPAPPHGVGSLLSIQDLDAGAAFLRKFALQTLLPRLEERANRLNAGITVARRGIKNRFTRLWKAASEDTINDKPYAWHSIEGGMRQLADIAFLLRHYEFAASTYRLAAQDYLSHNNVRWYAGVEEMLGLCCILEPSEGQDPQKYFMRAYENYSRLPGRLPRMLATRSMMSCAAYQFACGRYQSTSHALMRAHFEEENGRAALLLEQAAYSLLYMTLPFKRKFAFQLVLAGLRYHSCGQKSLALQAYRQVQSVYRGKCWRSIEEHLDDILGKQFREAREGARALPHLMALLDSQGGSGSRPVSTQQLYLDQFMEVARAVQTKQDGSQAIEGLPLPVMDLRDIRSQYDDTACFSNAEARAQPSSLWARLESCVSNDQSGGNNWLDTSSKQQKDNEDYNSCVAGETITVAVQIKNPLGIRLRVSGFRLTCEFNPDPSVTLSAPTATTGGTSVLSAGSGQDPSSVLLESRSAQSSSSTGGPQGGIGDREDNDPLARKGPSRPRNQHLQVSDASFTLHPGETVTEQLRVVPLSPGWLRITGVQWVLNDAVEGRRTFDVVGRRRKNPKGDRLGQQKHFPAHRRLLFSVAAAMPRLEMELNGLPKTMYQCEVALCTAVLYNSGTLPLRNLQLVLSSPEVVCLSDPSALRLPLLHALQDPHQAVLQSRLPNTSTALPAQAQLYKVWGPGFQLQPGEKMEWPLLVYPQSTGKLNFNCLWYCEPMVPVSAMRFRTLRHSSSLEVLPLVTVSPTVSSSPYDLRVSDVKLELAVPREAEHLSVLQVACITGSQQQQQQHSGSWLMLPMTPSSRDLSTMLSTAQRSHRPSSLKLSPGDSSSLFLHLMPPTAAVQHKEQAAQQQGGASEVLHQGSGSFELLSSGGILQHLLSISPASPGLGITSRPASATALKKEPPLQGGAKEQQTSTTSSSSLSHSLLPADPSVDLVVAWQVASNKGGSQMAGRAASAHDTYQKQQVRFGISRLGDILKAKKPLQQPITVMLRAKQQAAQQASQVTSSLSSTQGAAGSVPPWQQLPGSMAVIRHDFRANSMCVVGLQLALRNCAAEGAEVHVEVGGGWSGATLKDTWMMGSAAVVHQAPAPTSAAASEASFAAPPTPSRLDTTLYTGPQRAAVMGSPSSEVGASMIRNSVGGLIQGVARVVVPPAEGSPVGRTAGTADVLPGTMMSRGSPGGLASGGSSLSFQAGLPPSAEYTWCGRTCTRVGTVEGGVCKFVDLQVGVFRPGTYSIDGCNVSTLYPAAAAAAGTPARQGMSVQTVTEKLLIRVDAL
ncbi:hypothetical protein CEUSTIGMA_g7798.t1 [Chlamydomonas eustigma]|uniref:Uncharacterized protein n=1 Tax=Chlamydomonas eustigma TaxID=1157962 RepID=A0A250XBT0_9CHLO|nr:hypothetical protein CEUSTIGMA_g7798.t1 [Chlamydomonas eustigma]|eukprot:GAX80359.1 hypothetical protein CEUSTIGMA_g7798.t1 [Chlamydomonas eustigma]